MHRAEIKAKFDEIVAFAEVERFLDTPVKRYSSGMYVRLAFAVAAHLEPEILIVDEVLAVGDVEFQQKCLGKMQDFSEREGRTVLFVSHNIMAVQTLCSSVIRLKFGRMVGMGHTSEQINLYLQDTKREQDEKRSLSISGGLELTTLRFNPNPVVSKQPVEFVVALCLAPGVKLVDLALLFYSPLGTRVAVIDLRKALNSSVGDVRLSGSIRSLALVEGDYSVGLYINSTHFRGDLMDLALIEVRPAPVEVGAPPPYDSAHRGTVELDYSCDVLPASVGSPSSMP